MKYHYITRGLGEAHSSPPTFIHSFGDLCRSSSRVCMYIQGYRRGATRTRLTNCLCLSPAIFSPGYCFAECDRPTERTSSGRTDGRTDGVERAAAAHQPARNITRPRSHGVYPLGPMLREISRTIRMLGRPRLSASIPCRTHKIHRLGQKAEILGDNMLSWCWFLCLSITRVGPKFNTLHLIILIDFFPSPCVIRQRGTYHENKLSF